VLWQHYVHIPNLDISLKPKKLEATMFFMELQLIF